MQNFINYVIDFIESIFNGILNKIPSATTFYNKNVFLDNSLIGLNLTWSELFYIIGSIIFIIFFIVIFIKLFIKIVEFFKI